MLQHDFRRLRIEFAPASFRPGVLYQYRLEPADGEWSRWTGEPFIDYTNLAPGHYTFHLRDRGVEAVSEETRWLFRVRAPWYRTAWAVALWLLAGVAVVMGIVMLRTCSLRVQAERLRQKIAERTESCERPSTSSAMPREHWCRRTSCSSNPMAGWSGCRCSTS